MSAEARRLLARGLALYLYSGPTRGAAELYLLRLAEESPEKFDVLARAMFYGGR